MSSNPSIIGRRSSLAGLTVALATLCFAGTALAERATLKYKSQIALKASPQKAWDSFKTFDAIHTWHPATEGAHLLVGSNGKPLAVREFKLKGDPNSFVISELLAYNEARQWFRYRIIKTSLPMANYVAEMWVKPAAGGGSVVHWSATFQRGDESPKPDQDDAATEKLIQTVFKAGLDNIAVITSR